MKYIGDVEELNIESAMSLADRGVDVFNAQDAFFNDICQPFDNADGIDIIIDDRKKEFLEQNLSLCEINCSYIDYDINTKKSYCDCLIKNNMELISEIIDNPNIKKLSKYRYVITPDGKIGLSRYCRSIGKLHLYEKIRDILDEYTISEATEDEIINIIKDIP